jgi:hypothetical protein
LCGRWCPRPKEKPWNKCSICGENDFLIDIFYKERYRTLSWVAFFYFPQKRFLYLQYEIKDSLHIVINSFFLGNTPRTKDCRVYAKVSDCFNNARRCING